jgi:hypothetical protein
MVLELIGYAAVLATALSWVLAIRAERAAHAEVLVPKITAGWCQSPRAD